MSGHILVVDIGSSTLKAVLFDRAGAIVAARSHPVTTRGGAAGVQEQDADEWWLLLKTATAELPEPEAVAAMVLTGSMQNLIACDAAGMPLGPAILYSDRRLEESEIDALARRLPTDYAQRTGNRLDPAHTILKLMCRERFLPDDMGRGGGVRWLFGAKDALILRMTGRAVVDPTTATTTGLMNISSRQWDDELMAAASVDRAALPDIAGADDQAGTLLPGPAAELGLPAGTPVFVGPGDAAGATWGAGADRPGAAYAYIGTTGWVAATLPLAEAAPPRDIYTLGDPVHADRAIVVSPFLTAGAALDWAARLCGMEVGALLDLAHAEDAAPPSVLFLPYLCGERAPFEDQRVRGALIGMDMSHGAGAVGHAVLEGIAFAIRHNLEAAGLPATPLTLIGGGARDRLQRQLLADVLGCDIHVPPDGQEMTAYGALRMVAGTLGLSLPITAAPAGAVVRPRPERRDRCERRYQAYLDASSFARASADGLRQQGNLQ